MLEKIHGKSRYPVAVAQISEQLDKLDLHGTFYTGYPIIASADDAVFIEAMLVTEEHGLVIFDIFNDFYTINGKIDWGHIQERQDRLYFAVNSNLTRHQSLRRGRELGVPINIITYCPGNLPPPESSNILVAGLGTLASALSHVNFKHPEYLRPLNAALQRISTIKPIKKREAVHRQGSKGAILKEIERNIANLDQWQKSAAIESPDGPQRIRGLAGSGKTIVLALKAAYLHTLNPDWNIALTFYTRSLYQQFKDLIRRFTFEHINDEPNLDKLQIIHAWGSPHKPGVYAQMATLAGQPIRDFNYAKATFGTELAFFGVCRELLEALKGRRIEPIYDAILMDEAQDMPGPFFQLVYAFTKPPKRIVWAYDELQNLTNSGMPLVASLFGKDAAGKPLVTLTNVEGEPRQDLILPICYRNTPWSLAMAHALGFGIYRKEGLLQDFDDPRFWTEIGYEAIRGTLERGKQVELKRRENSYPPYFAELLEPEEAVGYRVYENEIEQAEDVADAIATNLCNEELDADDILVILPHALTASKDSAPIRNALARRGIASHLVGVTSSQDEMFSTNSIAISNIHRAKGNEAPTVYILNTQHCMGKHSSPYLRNVLFTAITRSRAWVRLCGWGPLMRELVREFEECRRRNYHLEFQIPTDGEREQIRNINRDRTESESARIQEAQDGLEKFLKAVRDGMLSIETLPPKLATQLKKIQQEMDG